MAEEIWGPPLGGSMMFVFKLVSSKKISIYEIGNIREVDNTLVLQLKHFPSDLRGWEEKDETVDFRLMRMEKDKAFFENFTLEKISEDEITLYVMIGDHDGGHREVVFNYQRQ